MVCAPGVLLLRPTPASTLGVQCGAGNRAEPGPGTVSPGLRVPSLHLCTRPGGWGTGKERVWSARQVFAVLPPFVLQTTACGFCVFVTVAQHASYLPSTAFAERLLRVCRGPSREADSQVCGTLPRPRPLPSRLLGEAQGKGPAGVCAQRRQGLLVTFAQITSVPVRIPDVAQR